MLSAKEEQIVAFTDAGMTVDQIAEQMGLKPNYVNQRVMHLCRGLGPNGAHTTAMRRGSKRLRDAVLHEKGLRHAV